jgi:hypothetical protein
MGAAHFGPDSSLIWRTLRGSQQGRQNGITNKGEPTAALLFGQVQPLERKPVIPSLYKLAELTLRTIQTLELFWFVEKAER